VLPVITQANQAATPKAHTLVVIQWMGAGAFLSIVATERSFIRLRRTIPTVVPVHVFDVINASNRLFRDS
jgi:hypothetical protein